ncbi:urease accessory protein UreD [Lusitaniella coriacea LEGE 07157]|uniref:Urease accessory protein UreD n=1 Tax=Lusitaniella coriacea LEGE 07157 TaxID=945747 RepID=A0A8J7DYE3_9CYAN|nr:urease accessory protein UreD [Lusitaniella coriacea]MBE9117817.1 urease accessory protein UreD [Lusitaniella coriacea LEGE 07157]
MSHSSSSWHGNLELNYRDRNGATQVQRAYTTAPLKVQRPFYPEGEKICHTIALHTAGGIVGGDRLSQNLHLQPQSHVLLTTAAATKVYRSNGQQAQQTITLKIDSGARLEWLPQETILFNGAIYQQKMRVELAPGATFLAWEITRLGRTARGEQFVKGEWRNSTEIWQDGKPLWIDRQWLPASQSLWDSPHGLGGQPIVASFLCLGQPISPEILEKMRNLGASTLNRGGLGGVTTTQEQGSICRYRGASTIEVKNWFVAIWQLLRLEGLQSSGIKPRVWQW